MARRPQPGRSTELREFSVPIDGAHRGWGRHRLPDDSDAADRGTCRSCREDGCSWCCGAREITKDLWLIDLATGEARQLTHFAPGFTVRDFDISPDGRQIVVEQVQACSDVVLIDQLRR